IPVQNNALSAARLLTNPESLLPPAFTHFLNSLAAPLISPLLSFLLSVELRKFPHPILKTNEVKAENWFAFKLLCAEILYQKLFCGRPCQWNPVLSVERITTAPNVTSMPVANCSYSNWIIVEVCVETLKFFDEITACLKSSILPAETAVDATMVIMKTTNRLLPTSWTCKPSRLNA
ncbi:hypothetical protein Ocin01_14000, partial [Orchesella cincta]